VGEEVATALAPQARKKNTLLLLLESNGSVTPCYLREFSRLTSLVYLQGFRVDLKGMSCACYGEGMYRGCNPS
jgi:pyruvate-formate lyase-activating enzyme